MCIINNIRMYVFLFRLFHLNNYKPKKRSVLKFMEDTVPMKCYYWTV